MKLAGKIISRSARPWAKPAEGATAARSGTIHTLTIRDADTEQLVEVASFALPLESDERYPLDGDFAETVTVTNMFRGMPTCRLASDRG